MKTPIKTLLMLLLAVPLLFISCAKDGIIDKQDAANTTNETNLKTDLVYCGTPTNYQMVDEAQSMAPGTVTIGNDQSQLLIKYQITPPAGYFVYRTALYVGPASGFLPAYGTLNGDGTGHFNYWSLPNQAYHSLATNLTYKEYLFDLDTLPDCFVVVAHVSLRTIIDPSATTEVYLWGKDLLKASGYYIQYCVQQCPPPPPPLGGCETAYAKAESDQLANCFLNIQGVTSNNWGWSNGPISANGVTYTWPMYAGAGQCNVANGTHVGNLTVVYNSGTPTGTAIVTYNTFPGYELNATHLYVGNQILPKKGNKYTTAPGQFPYKHENLGGVTSDIFTINGLSGNIYVAAHSEVCDAD
jgi:hypothetical protein